MEVAETVSLDEGKTYTVMFGNGSSLVWTVSNPKALHHLDIDGKLLVVQGPRFEAWNRHRAHRPENGADCCQHAVTVQCVCTRKTECIIHGSHCFGSH